LTDERYTFVAVLLFVVFVKCCERVLFQVCRHIYIYIYFFFFFSCVTVAIGPANRSVIRVGCSVNTRPSARATIGRRDEKSCRWVQIDDVNDVPQRREVVGW